MGFVDYGIHDNAIFSVKWVNCAQHFLTASGDQTIKLVDAKSGSIVSVFIGHSMSVRSLALWPENNRKIALLSYHILVDIFASASRDGSVRLWDSRTQNPGGVGATAYITGCHLPLHDASSRSRPKSRKSVTDAQSVTCVTFARQFDLVSAGSTDGYVFLIISITSF